MKAEWIIRFGFEDKEPYAVLETPEGEVIDSVGGPNAVSCALDILAKHCVRVGVIGTEITCGSIFGNYYDVFDGKSVTRVQKQ